MLLAYLQFTTLSPSRLHPPVVQLQPYSILILVLSKVVSMLMPCFINLESDYQTQLPMILPSKFQVFTTPTPNLPHRQAHTTLTIVMSMSMGALSLSLNPT